MAFIRVYSNDLFIVLALLFVGCFGVYIAPAYSQLKDYNLDRLKCEKLAIQAEEKYRLPKNILLSIARVESGYGKVNGITRSWPWTLNAGGDSAYFETKEDAIKELQTKLKKGVRNIDLGCMQINYKWHKKFFKTVNEMMEPSSNVEYGARFLKRLHQRHGSWDKAIKYYHSKKSKYNKPYLMKVKTVWQKENNNNSSTPTLLAKSSITKLDNLTKENKKVVPIVTFHGNKNKPLVKVINRDQTDSVQNMNQPMKVRATNFNNINVAKTDFDFKSFVKRVSKENSAMPKYIRDNWTIVVSIRNQLRDQK